MALLKVSILSYMNSAHVVDRARQLLQEWQDANLPRATAGL